MFTGKSNIIEELRMKELQPTRLDIEKNCRGVLLLFACHLRITFAANKKI